MDDDEFDVDALEEAEYEESARYTGPQPPSGTILPGLVKKAWWTETKKGDRMMKVIFEATDGKYNGLGVWDQIVFNTASKWRWAPFIEATGLTLKDIKNKNFVSQDDDNVGAPIEHIGKWTPGEDSTACRILTKREKAYNGDGWDVKVDQWLEYGEEDEEDEDEDEEVEEVVTPKTRRTATGKQATTQSKRRQPELEPEDDDDDEMTEEEEEELEDDEEEQPARKPARARAAARPTATGKRPARPATAGSARRTAVSGKVGGKPPTGKRRPAAADDDDPPF